MLPLILGSKTPRRKEIMDYFSLPYRQIEGDFDEESISPYLPPDEYVKQVAHGKQLSIRSSYPESIILTADTIVYHEGKILGKPKDREDMELWLSSLSGKWHSVYSAVVLSTQKSTTSEVVETKVLCTNISPLDIHRYIHSLALLDKAGSYSIQKSGSLLVEKIEGCFYNAMGLPIQAVRRLLSTIGIDLWDYIK